MKWLALSMLALAAPAFAAERAFTIAGEPFAQDDIVDARAQPQISGSASILLTLSDAASLRLRTLAAKRAKQGVPIVLDGRILAPALQHEAIDGSMIQLTGTFTLADAEALAKAISGKDPLPDSLED